MSEPVKPLALEQIFHVSSGRVASWCKLVEMLDDG
jgi:hypothetical protein